MKTSAALRRWSDPADFAELVRISGQEEPPAIVDAPGISDIEKRRKYQCIRERVEAVFKEKLIDAEVVGSGIGLRYREVIEPSLWEILEINYDEFEDAGGSGRRYEAIEFFEKTAIPQNVREIPKWLDDERSAEGHVAFRHDPHYREVWLNGARFKFGSIQGKVIGLLHEAALRNDPWQYGPRILGEAGSVQTKMVDLFGDRKDWRYLIESRSDGMYRLRLDD